LTSENSRLLGNIIDASSTFRRRIDIALRLFAPIYRLIRVHALYLVVFVAHHHGVG
jgi:hypothetical protein